MHDHNHELIMALAEGAPESTDTGTVAAIDSCSECLAELDLQRSALRFLRSATPVAMNDLERARLRRTLRSELGIAAASTASPPSRDARRFRLIAGLAGAAAVLIAVVVVGPGLDLLEPGGDDSTAESMDFAFATEAPTTADDAAATTEEGASVDQLMTGGDRQFNSSEAADGESDAPTTTSPALPLSTTADVQPDSPYIIFAAIELPETPDLSVLAADLSSAKSLDVLGVPTEDIDPRYDVFDEGACFRVGTSYAQDTQTAYVLGLSGINDVEVVVVAYVTGEFDAVVVVAHDIETCAVVATSSP